jgi:hypothetical protein
MALGKMERIAVEVPDIEAAAADFKKIFDIDMTLLDVPERQLRVGVCDEGIEIVRRTAPKPSAKNWKPPLGAVVFNCDDVDEVAARLEKAGFKKDHETILGGGLREMSFPDFHGLPLVITNWRKRNFIEGLLDKEGKLTVTVLGEKH